MASTSDTTRMEVTVTAKASQESSGESDVHVRVASVGAGARAALDLAIVIDISGSMDTEATIKNAAGQTESDGLTMLDLVKHATLTVANSLGDADRLSIVTYSTRARVETQLEHMDAKGRQHVADVLKNMHTEDCTNIFDGLVKACDVLKNRSVPKGKGASSSSSSFRVPAVLLLTDGQPNEGPTNVGAMTEAIRKYANQCQGAALPGIVSTFGFGYAVNAELLSAIAKEGHGAFGFIPDSGFCGTIFVNATANLLATAATRLSLQLTPLNGALIASGNPSGDVGSLQIEQPRDFIVRMKNLPADGRPYVRVVAKSSAGECTVEGTTVITEGTSADLDAAVCRMGFVRALEDVLDAPNNGKSTMQHFTDAMRRSPSVSDRRIAAILEDADGQVAEALSRDDFFKKWGRLFLVSLANAHALQQCNNFKDPGVQVYGGKLFSELRDQLDDVFNKLPPPTPSRQKRVVDKSGGVRYVAPSGPISIAAYNDCNSGCWDASCRVLLADGSLRRTSDIVKGDLVASAEGSASVLCVVRTCCAKGRASMVHLPGGPIITPWHPVLVGGVWQFPCEVSKASDVACEAMYTLVLSSGHVATVEGVQCVTLGHGFTGDKREHPYYGSQAVVNDMRVLPGWNAGMVDLSSAALVRDAHTSLVSRIVPATNEC